MLEEHRRTKLLTLWWPRSRDGQEGQSKSTVYTSPGWGDRLLSIQKTRLGRQTAQYLEDCSLLLSSSLKPQLHHGSSQIISVAPNLERKLWCRLLRSLGGLYFTCSQDAERVECWYLSGFLLCSATFRVRFSHFSKPSLKASTCPESCLRQFWNLSS